MVRTRLEMARDVALKIEHAATQEQIVKAWGKTKAGIDGRTLRELSLDQLRLLPELSRRSRRYMRRTSGRRRASKIDRQAAKRIHKGKGMTGTEKLMQTQLQVAKAMGVEAVDGATGRKLSGE
jgi:hypothetical protein